jgi:hypothetical protein
VAFVMQCALTSLCGMYDNSNKDKIQDKIQNVEIVKNLLEEKNMVDKKYTSLLGM